jgi:hypothetical protein
MMIYFDEGKEDEMWGKLQQIRQDKKEIKSLFD